MATPTLVTVLGAGSWGSALAIQLARNGYHTTLWGRDVAQMSAMRSEQQNSRYLPGISFPQHLHPTSDLVAALQCPTTLLIVVPSGAFRHTLEQIQPLVAAGCDIAWATKGLEQGSGKLLHQVFAEVMGEERGCAVVSGPTFATEVAHGLPTAVTVAAVDEALASRVACQLHGESFRAYTSTDMVSVELGGACKNVLAIAAGIADGLGFGANTRAALITRGLAEMVRLGTAIGGSAETLMGLAGLGDLLLTCTDDQSRNRRVGLGLVGERGWIRSSHRSVRRWKGSRVPRRSYG